MPRFSRKSLRELETCDPMLQYLFKEVVKHFDCSVIEGKRSLEDQQELLNEGATKTLDSAHLTGRAVDVYPYPVDFEDRDRWHYFGGFVLGTARQFGIDVIWGGDWDNDTKTKDNTFDDLMHFELR
tara:strand:- start:2459 stop:2836 length:378 start_codon:yes stop_codon:yes gene_type:complete